MKNFHSIYHFLSTLLLKSRKKQDITVNQLCKTSGVSTRTYSKLVKHILVKPDCYARLVIGFCKNVDKEDFLKFWIQFGEWIYGEYGEEWGKIQLVFCISNLFSLVLRCYSGILYTIARSFSSCAIRQYKPISFRYNKLCMDFVWKSMHKGWICTINK